MILLMSSFGDEYSYLFMMSFTMQVKLRVGSRISKAPSNKKGGSVTKDPQCM